MCDFIGRQKLSRVLSEKMMGRSSETNTNLVFCDGRRLLQHLFDRLHDRLSAHGAHRTHQLHQQQLLLTGDRNHLEDTRKDQY